MPGLDLITGAGILWLAAGSGGCAVPAPPRILIDPVTAPIFYEERLSAEELGRLKGDTANPYAPGTDTSTGGLRHDRPQVRTKVQWSESFFPATQKTCFWYDEITVTIALSPTIYIARERQKAPACREAILEHEMWHVDTDREVINEIAQQIGLAVKRVVDGAGAMGPYDKEEGEKIKKRMIDSVQAAVDSQKPLLEAEMARRQAQVDTLEEYERISRICHDAEK